MPCEVKICGLTRPGDAEAAAAAGADYLGFVFYAGSPRCVTAAQVRAIAAGLPARARRVGVFVNAARDAVLRDAEAAGLDIVQIHGDEPAADFAGLPLPVWRAVRARGGALEPEPGAWPAARYVVDAAAPGLYGGSGVAADWDAAARLAQQHAVMLAGGLTPENVAAAVAAVRPLGVDVSSGVEAAPGHKDIGRVRAFIAAARAAGAA